MTRLFLVLDRGPLALGAASLVLLLLLAIMMLGYVGFCLVLTGAMLGSILTMLGISLHDEASNPTQE